MPEQHPCRILGKATMFSRAHARVRSTAWSVTTATAMAAALIAAPPVTQQADAAGVGTFVHGSGPSLQTVTLVTGDRVVLRTDAAGKVSASLTPGSPHYGRPVEFADTGAQSWLVPKLARSVRSKLDNSVFDVSALAARHGRVPLTVTFARGATPHSLPGLHVRTATARKAAHGRTATTASYDARRVLPASLARSLSGVSRIALRGVSSVGVPTGYDLHTLDDQRHQRAGPSAPLRRPLHPEHGRRPADGRLRRDQPGPVEGVGAGRSLPRHHQRLPAPRGHPAGDGRRGHVDHGLDGRRDRPPVVVVPRQEEPRRRAST